MLTSVIVGLVFIFCFLCVAAYQWYIKDKGAAFIFIAGAVLLFLVLLPLLVTQNEVHISKPNCNVQHARGEQDGLPAYASIRIAPGASGERYIF